MKPSSRIAAIPPSPTLSISTKAAELKASGKDIVSFSAGEPDFDTPAAIREAATFAMNSGQTHYTAVGGSPQLKDAIAAHYERKIGIRYASNEIIASSGAKHSLYNLFLTLLEPGDEVIIPAPYWVSYPTQVKIAEGVPVGVMGRPENGFLPTIEDLEAAVTERTRAIVINNPTNPTGAFWTREDLQAIAGLARGAPQHRGHQRRDLRRARLR